MASIDDLSTELLATLPDFLKGSKINFDFNQIKSDLKEYLQNQSQFDDYNFDASGMSILLDVLAYNAQMQAMTGHLALNEVFLDSAQARPNVVSAAKQLGYLPASASSPVATVDLVVTPKTSNPPSFLQIDETTKFVGGGFVWRMTGSKLANLESGSYTFSNVDISQGKPKTIRYYYDSRIEYPKFEIPDIDVDLSSLTVRLKDSDSSTFFYTYNKFSSFNTISTSARIYFIQENALGRYEVYFTNNDVGISPKNGNIIELSYKVSAGTESNGVSVFSVNEAILNSSETRRVTTIRRASGGSDREKIESIRANAPVYFKTQNRCVTTEDYSSVILQEFPSTIESITTWGGENNQPPEYGRVYISIKPVNGDALSAEEKRHIVNDIVKPKNVATITPIIVDPEYVWIGLNVVVKYNDTQTTNSKNQIELLVRQTINNYNTKKLQRFEKVFQHSRILADIDNTELSIQNSSATVYLIKKLYPLAGVTNQFNIKIPSDLYNYTAETSLIRSSPIVISGREYFITDVPVVNEEFKRTLQLIYYDSFGNEVISLRNIGQMNLLDKSIYIYNIHPDTNDVIKLYFDPNSLDIPPYQNQFLRIDMDEVTVRAEEDTFRSTGTYTATPKS